MCIPCHYYSMAFMREAVISVILVSSTVSYRSITSVTETFTVCARIYDDEDDDDDYEELRKAERGRQPDIITRILCIHCLLVVKPVVLLSSSVTQTDSRRCGCDRVKLDRRSRATVSIAVRLTAAAAHSPSLWKWIDDAQTRLVARTLLLSPSN